LSQQVLELTNLTKYFGAKLVLDRVSLLINRTDRIGLVGENGTGKTTIAKIAMRALESDTGQVLMPDGLEVGYLPQEVETDEAITVQQFLERSMGQLDRMRDELAALENDMAQPDLAPDHLSELLERYGALQEEFSRRGGYDGEYRIEQVFSGLDLTHIDRARSLRALSGGEKTRVMLASLLLRSPDLLILDEPTNHLDFAAVDWLEDYLIGYQGALLIISHDRHFLNKVVNQIAELSPTDHTLTVYVGNYDDYLAARERQLARQMEAYEAQQAEIKLLQQTVKATAFSSGSGRPMKDGNKMSYDHHGGKIEKSKAHTINAAKQRLLDIADNPIARVSNRWQISPDFAPEELASREVIRLIDVSKSYDDRAILDNVTATVQGGDRVVLQGPNGIGKTTLLKLILGLETPDTGRIAVTGGARIGYLDQEQETLDPAQTVLEAYSHDLIGTEDQHRANLHRYGLFSGDQVFQQVGDLSVGQRRKLQIARLIGRNANVLLLDEPTNHLDLESIERFESALCAFRGTILAVSHDRFFIDKVATVIWSIEDGKIKIERREPTLRLSAT